MAGPESEHIYGVQLRESADDGSDFSSADADYRILFLGEDGFLHAKNSSGTVSDPYDTSGAGVASGTSFPMSPSDTDLFLRTDRDLLYRYYSTGTKWLSEGRLVVPLNVRDSVNFTGISATTSPVARGVLPWKGTYQLWCTRVDFATLVLTTNDASNNWSLAVTTQPGNNAVGTVTTVGDTAGVQSFHSLAVNAALTSTDHYLNVVATKVLSPGNFFMIGAAAVVQLIG